MLDLGLGDELHFETPIAFLLQVNIWDMVQHSGPVGMLVLGVLLCFSVYSWTVIFSKWQRSAGRGGRIRVSCALFARPAAWKR